MALYALLCSFAGCDRDICFSDAWAMDLSADTPEWSILIDPSSNSSGPIPEARFTVAGGVYPGSDQLWLCMGETKAGLKLSDTWILQISNTDEGISGQPLLTISNFWYLYYSWCASFA